MDIYYIDYDRGKKNTAGAKAPDDIARLCRQRGYNRLDFPAKKKWSNKFCEFIWTAFACITSWLKVCMSCKRGSVIIMQHPMYGRRYAYFFLKMLQRRRGCKFIAVVHDLESLRGGISGVISKNEKAYKFSDEVFLKKYDVVICHNERMKEYMVQKGFEREKLVCLGIFDYLLEKDYATTVYSEEPVVVVAGNLAYGKSRYIYEMADGKHNPHVKVELFGAGYQEERATDNMRWNGSFKPEELPGHMKGMFGIVWDGEVAQTCSGNTGEYLRYNNPHKTSLYLSSGMPVVVWEDAAIADFIKENKVGVTVDSLWKLEERLKGISKEEYEDMCRATRELSKLMRSGHYFYRALDESMRNC